ncbi:MAG TPA: hypothetical protein DDX39_00645 [Bacteroidales bacterium]|nr:MAG: hypothetical protein A2W98_08195 [Bacteroidetes bacterium GWF2_33_38]HBF87119.1 hypothetical protein [Bacteroidales bacterium]
MKTVITKTVIAVIFAAFSFTSAQADGLKDNNEKKLLTNSVKRQITYPESAKIENKTGIVLVDLFVTENGKLVINQINASDNVFKSHVEKKIEEMNKYNDYSGLIGQNLLYKFKFNLE